MKRPLTILAWIGRMMLAVVFAGFIVLVATQFTHMIARNVAATRDLREIERDVIALRSKQADLENEIRRLADPRGAVPEIHDRLHLTGPNEAIIYLKGAPPTER